MPDHTETPKWKLQANWLLKELIRIWHGYTEPKSLFEGRSFVKTFKQIMVQYLHDYGSSAPQIEIETCITIRRLTFSARHNSEPTFTSQAYEAEWTAEATTVATSCTNLYIYNIV